MLRLFIVILFSLGGSHLYAFGPLKNMSHLTYEEMGQSIRLTFQMNYADALSVAKLTKPAASQEEFRKTELAQIFAKTIGEFPVLMNGEPCQWTKPGGIRSDTTVQIQVVATCKELAHDVHWSLGFLKEMPEDYFIAIEAYFAGGEKVNDMIFSANPVFQRSGSVFKDYFFYGMEFLGLAPGVWLNDFGKISIPVGVFVVLFYILTVTTCQSIGACVGCFLAFSLAAIAGHFLPLNLAKDFPTALLLASLAFCFALMTVSGKQRLYWLTAITAVNGFMAGVVLRWYVGYFIENPLHTLSANLGLILALMVTHLVVLIVMYPWSQLIHKKNMTKASVIAQGALMGLMAWMAIS